jgi:hypothetical protein
MADKPWKNQLTLHTLVATAYHLDAGTVLSHLYCLNPTLAYLFLAFGLETMDQWNANVHIPAYLCGEVLPDHPPRRRLSFSSTYSIAARRMEKWFQSLISAERHVYQPFLLPVANPLLTEGILRWGHVIGEQQHRRKTETSAVVPHFPKLRAEAHFRFAMMARLRQAYRDALEEINQSNRDLPFYFFYDEGGDPEKGIPAQERFHFRIWDRRSFVLAHRSSYSRNTINAAENRLMHYAAQKFYLEFVKSESLINGTSPRGLWF